MPSGDHYTLSLNEKDDEVSKRSETTLNIFAVNPSWIRIKDGARQVVVEKILKAGEVLEIENKWFSGDLRAGNAKDLFFSLNGVTYGPVSDKRNVIKNFKIDPQNIFNSLKINDLEDSYLNSLLKREGPYDDFSFKLFTCEVLGVSLDTIRPWRQISRRKSREISVGNVKIGGDNPISVQTMTNTITADINKTIAQVNNCADAGAEIVEYLVQILIAL